MPKIFKKYTNLLQKKVLNDLALELLHVEYSPSKFAGVNGKIRDLVDSNYDMNRGAFYAYGAYVNNVGKSEIKKIFRTELINVDALAKGFGFPVGPRVKGGTFLKERKRLEQKILKRQRKRALKKQNQHSQ